MKNLDADVRGGGGGFGNSDTPGQGEGGWFENPRFWRTSFVDGPLLKNCDVTIRYLIAHCKHTRSFESWGILNKNSFEGSFVLRGIREFAVSNFLLVVYIFHDSQKDGV